MDVVSVQLNASYGSQMPLEFAAVALAARLVCTQQDLHLAESITTAIQSRIRENGHTALIPCADALVCRVSLLGDGVYADTWYHQQTPESVKPSVQNRYPCLTMARCCIRRQEYQRADTLLEWLTGPLKSEGRVLDVIESLLLSAVCRRRMGIGEDAWRPLLAEAMELAQPYGYTALFAELGAAVKHKSLPAWNTRRGGFFVRRRGRGTRWRVPPTARRFPRTFWTSRKRRFSAVSVRGRPTSRFGNPLGSPATS